MAKLNLPPVETLTDAQRTLILEDLWAALRAHDDDRGEFLWVGEPVRWATLTVLDPTYIHRREEEVFE